MGLIIILIGFYFDYKSEKSSFFNDLSGGIFICAVFFISAIVLKEVLKIHFLNVAFIIGIEIILVFALKAFFNSKKKH
ncbi:hypothetical protein [uncultured Lacinutrix sp.]|uniref:hypothetical protein n=1 Tax=uncultured Lacinutrix sp. TaxID=574032 RepID=UPI002629D337|nr:hypothetical protein [uncultured Lacinutrix sp.]